jgi:phage terminase large subunit-like protein
MGKQPGAMGLVISVQAATDDHALSEMIDVGLGDDPSPDTYVQLHDTPEGADPFDPATWEIANFALGHYLSRSELSKMAARARKMPGLLPSFRNYVLNQRVYAEGQLITRDDWLACAGEVDPEKLRGKRCWGGLDLSSTTDLTALVLVFEGGEVLAWHWIPEGRLDHLMTEDKQAYRRWRDEGWIECPPGRAINKRFIVRRLAQVAQDYDLQEVGYDEWRFADLQQIMEEEALELPLTSVRQGVKTMAHMVDAMEGDIVDARITHGSNLCLTMCVANAVAKPDEHGHRKIVKPKTRAKVDGAVCLAMACGLRATALQKPPDQRAFSQMAIANAFQAA